MSIAIIPHALSVSLSNMTSSNGNIGIGTTTPAYPLDIVGNMRVNGTLTASNIAVSGTFLPFSSPSYTYNTSGSYAASTWYIGIGPGILLSGGVYMVTINFGAGVIPFGVSSCFTHYALGTNVSSSYGNYLSGANVPTSTAACNGSSGNWQMAVRGNFNNGSSAGIDFYLSAALTGTWNLSINAYRIA